MFDECQPTTINHNESNRCVAYYLFLVKRIDNFITNVYSVRYMLYAID